MLILFFLFSTISFIEESSILSDIPQKRMKWLMRIESIIYREKGSLISFTFRRVHGAAEMEIKVQYKMFLSRNYLVILLQFHGKNS